VLYSRAVSHASGAVKEHLKEKRRLAFESLPADKKTRIATAWIDACCSDDSIVAVKNRVLEDQNIHVDGFYLGSDGTETCGLHASAFHGSCQVLEFLCHGLDEHVSRKEGGLAYVNLTDSNGWSALHFATGANSVPATRICVTTEQGWISKLSMDTPLAMGRALAECSCGGRIKAVDCSATTAAAGLFGHCESLLCAIPTTAS
jgi:hypothetical protein